MSIVRVGLAETRKFSEGWEAIFGRKKKGTAKKAESARKKERKPTNKKKS